LGCRGSGFPLYLPKGREDAASILNAGRDKKKETRSKKKEKKREKRKEKASAKTLAFLL
jgi:hypothetical protein